ncbi:MAG: HAD family hydrolase [Paramuribaculum sp.]|nr:HAD family hydrolase [Paramuribaculum sp.]MDE7470757.1 HAD family hydrolase [Paramuribaculum sp.]
MKYDSIIFDMDGTLWDAVDSYCKVWDVTFAEIGRNDLTVTSHALIRCMGMPIARIYDEIVTDPTIDRDRFLTILDRNELEMMPRLGGKLYPGVEQTLRELARTHRLFMVSNCGPEGLHNFVALTGLADVITDTLTHGQTQLPKDGNIKLLIEKYGLQSPVYVGDTASDCTSAHKAGIPFIHAAYGFGSAPDADAAISSITMLPALV